MEHVSDQFGPQRLTWQRAIFPGVFLVTLVSTLAGVDNHTDGAASAVGYTILAEFCVVYVVGINLLGHPGQRRFWISWAALCALFVAETFFAHEDALAMLTFIGTLAIAVLWRRAIPLVIALIALAMFLPPAVPSWHQGVDADAGFTLAIVLGAMFAFFNLMRINGQLTEARAEIALLAAESERQRIARDLHDLLGHSLTTITVKAGLARRLFERGEPERAAHEIAEVEDLSRSSLADVRAAVAGYRATTLTGELATGRELMRTLGIRVEFPPSADAVDPAYHELFGWVVREGLTNVVRHAHATTCTISLGRNWIEIADDGAGMGFAPGNGLMGLTERVQQAGGALTAGRGEHGWVLRAQMTETTATPSPRLSVGAGDR
ncbi:MAG: two-component system histidine kinase [Ilumatobacteraceae bacterium]|nr:two-component system histidine kinase [Ilumatobacteraceae bacterium]